MVPGLSDLQGGFSRRLKTVRQNTLLKLRGVGVGYAAKIAQWQRSAVFASSVAWAGPMIQTDARRMLQLSEAIAALEVQIEQLAEQSTMAQRLLSMPGFGLTCAAELTAEVGNIDCFADEAAFSVYLGVAPLDQSSGKRFGARLPRQINPRARDALLIAVVHHMGQVPQSRAFYDRKREQGKTHMQALRALARHLARVLFNMLRHNRDYRRPDEKSGSQDLKIPEG